MNKASSNHFNSAEQLVKAASEEEIDILANALEVERPWSKCDFRLAGFIRRFSLLFFSTWIVTNSNIPISIACSVLLVILLWCIFLSSKFYKDRYFTTKDILRTIKENHCYNYNSRHSHRLVSFIFIAIYCIAAYGIVLNIIDPSHARLALCLILFLHFNDVISYMPSRVISECSHNNISITRHRHVWFRTNSLSTILISFFGGILSIFMIFLAIELPFLLQHEKEVFILLCLPFVPILATSSAYHIAMQPYLLKYTHMMTFILHHQCK